MLFVSHRLEEIFAACQRVTVMRDGRHVLTKPIGEVTIQSVIRAMVGRDMEALFPKVPTEPGRVVLQVERLTREGVFTDVSFDVRSGEIVALAGLVGAGRTEVARAIFGIDRWDAGSVEIDGRRLPPASPTAAMAAGIGLVPEDRRQQGLVMDFSIERNIALASLDSVRRGGLIPRGAERRFASDWALRLKLKYGRLTNPVWTLSGGNQQKAVLAKWLARKPTLLIVDEPTRGIDVGTKAEVHRLLSRARCAGRGRADDLVGAPGGARHGRPRRRALRGPRDRRVRAGGRDRGRDHARGHGPRRGRRVNVVAEERPAVERRTSSHAFAELLFRFRELGIVLALVIVVGAATIDNHRFLSTTNVQQIVSGAAIIALLAIGQTIVVITRNVDLSIGSVLGISAYASGALYRHDPHVSMAVVFLLALGDRRRLRCDQRGNRHGRPRPQPGRDAGHALHHPGDRRRMGRREPGQRLDAATALQQDRLRHRRRRSLPRDHRDRRRRDRDLCDAQLPHARDFYAIGSDPDAARLAGIPVGSRVFLAFVMSGAIAGITGALWLSYYASVDAIAGVGYEFQVIAAVVVGGVAIFGGSGTVLGATLGALLLATIYSALVVVNVSSFWSAAISGGLLIAAIAFDRLIALRVAPALRTRRRNRG